MREYRVMCSNMNGTYSAGKYIANSPDEACEMARVEYRNSFLGRALKDVGAFRFYVVSQFPYEREAENE